jgi:hypothetical protein
LKRSKGIIAAALLGLAATLVSGALATGAGAAELGNPSAPLASGMISGGFSWNTKIEAPRTGEHGDICVTSTLHQPPPEEPLGPEHLQNCETHAPGLLSLQVLSNAQPERNLLVLTFSAGTRKAFVDLGKRGVATVELTPLSHEQAAQLGVPAVSVFARGFVGHLCLRRVIAFDANGHKLTNGVGSKSCVIRS